MDSLQDNVEDLFAHVNRYLETQKRLFQLKIAEKSASVVSEGVVYLVLGLFGVFTVGFLAVGLGFYFSSIFESHAMGFGLVGAIFLLVFLIFYTNKKHLVRDKISNQIISKYFDDNEK